MKRTEHSIGEALVGLLEAYDVDTIFGIPGVHNIEMYRALPRSKIRHILPRHEQGAGFMADGYARATGKPGVCFTISGPGLTNIMTPIAQAWSDSSNILVVSTALDTTFSPQGRGRLHEIIDQFGAAKSVTANATRAYTAQDVQDGLAAAFSQFASARPRPSYLEIPLNILSEPAGDGWEARMVPSRPLARPEQIAQVVSRLKASKNPLIILGGGAMEAGPAALKISEAVGAPIFVTTAGKGTVPADHPSVVEYRLQSPDAWPIIHASDCILAVGTELSETDFWNLDFKITKNLIRIDIDPKVLARPHIADIAVLGDAAHALDAIAAQLTTRKSTKKPEIETLQDPSREVLGKIVSAIREALPLDTVVASDMSQIAYTANEVFPCYQPRTWLHPVGLGTLGFALPIAIGAKFGAAEKPVAALMGDYGFQYTHNELGTAVEHKLPIPILLWNNDALGQIHDHMRHAGIQPNAVTLRNPDFQMLAKAYGARAERPENLKALVAAIKSALKADGPTLIEMTPRMMER